MIIQQTTQIHVPTPDQVGQLARVLGIVKEAGVNILAYAGYKQGDGGHILLVTEDNDRIAGLLKDDGFEVHVQRAVLVIQKDEVGCSAEMARKIAAAGINLTGAYATAAAGDYLTIYQAEDLDALMAALQ
jgi:hypothetical protein